MILRGLVEDEYKDDIDYINAWLSLETLSW